METTHCSKFIKASKNLYYSSFTTIFSVITAFYYNILILSLSTFIVLICSCNYWRYPIKGIRRNLDITFVIVSLILHIYYTIIYNYFEYIYLLLLGFLSYYISNYFINKQYFWLGCQFHILLHLFININNVFLYIHIGNIEDKSFNKFLYT